MNDELSRLASETGIHDEAHEAFRLAFGLACAARVRHLLEDRKAIECLAVLQAYVEGEPDRSTLMRARKLAAEVANSHRGSNSIDGAAHAAVSATYAVANALAGRALEAASYAAYAAVYAYGGYAVNEPSAFESEFAWQVEKFKELRAASANAGSLAPDRPR